MRPGFSSDFNIDFVIDPIAATYGVNVIVCSTPYRCQVYFSYF